MSTNTQFPKGWLNEIISYFGAFGFFHPQGDPDEDARHLANRINLYSLFPDGPFDPKNYNGGFLAEQEILALDKSRTWYQDAEADFEVGDYWYVRTLLDWSRISRGCFRPQNLSEVWEPVRIPDPARPDFPEQDIKISFSLGDKQSSFKLQERSGWMDYSLIGKVNEAIVDSGYQFASVVPPGGDQTVFICCFTKAEILKLKNERGWSFHDEFFAG